MTDFQVKGKLSLLSALEDVRRQAMDAEEKIKKYTSRESMPTDNKSSLKRSNNASQSSEGVASKRPYVSSNSMLASTVIRPISMRDFASTERASNVGLSSVVEVAKRPSRIERLREMGGPTNKHSKEDVERGRRMMSLMLGRLHAFKVEVEQEKNSAKNIHRQELQERIQRQEMEKQEEFKREKEELLRAQRLAKYKMRQMELKCQAAEAFAEWAENQFKMKNHIRTTTKPHVFYRPKQCNEEALKRLQATRQILKDTVERRKKSLEDEIAWLATGDNENIDVPSRIASHVVVRESHSMSGDVEDLPASLHGDSFSEVDVDDYPMTEPTEELSEGQSIAVESIIIPKANSETDVSPLRQNDNNKAFPHETIQNADVFE